MAQRTKATKVVGKKGPNIRPMTCQHAISLVASSCSPSTHLTIKFSSTFVLCFFFIFNRQFLSLFKTKSKQIKTD